MVVFLKSPGEPAKNADAQVLPSSPTPRPTELESPKVGEIWGLADCPHVCPEPKGHWEGPVGP